MSKTRHKLIFLGTDLNPISLGCLKALAASNRYDFLVGIDQQKKPFLWRVKMTWRRYGLLGVAHRILTLIVTWAKTRLHPVGAHTNDGRSLREVAKLGGMKSFFCSQVNGPKDWQTIRAFNPDIIVIANFSQFIRAKVRQIPKLGAINFHPSLLPKYRGPTPCYWIIKNSETKSGVSVHIIDDGIDSGDIIMQQEFLLHTGDTEGTLIARAVEIGAPLLVHAVESVIAGTAQRKLQIESEATYFGFP